MGQKNEKKDEKIIERNEKEVFPSHFRLFEKKVENYPQKPKSSKWRPFVSVQARTKNFAGFYSSINELSNSL